MGHPTLEPAWLNGIRGPSKKREYGDLKAAATKIRDTRGAELLEGGGELAGGLEELELGLLAGEIGVEEG